MQQGINNKQDIFKLITAHKHSLRAFGASRLALFGSFVRNEQRPESDVDLLIEFEAGKKNYRNFIGAVYFLEDILKREVELVTTQSLTASMKNLILKEAEYVSLVD